MRSPENQMEQEYELFEEIGRGALATVYNAWRKKDGLHCAVKRLNKDTSDKDVQRQRKWESKWDFVSGEFGTSASEK